jgi:hypothetical protein
MTDYLGVSINTGLLQLDNIMRIGRCFEKLCDLFGPRDSDEPAPSPPNAPGGPELTPPPSWLDSYLDIPPRTSIEDYMEQQSVQIPDYPRIFDEEVEKALDNLSPEELRKLIEMLLDSNSEDGNPAHPAHRDPDFILSPPHDIANPEYLALIGLPLHNVPEGWA